MASETVPRAEPASIESAQRRILHEPFSWTPSYPALRGLTVTADRYGDLASKTLDVANGVRQIMAMLEQDEIDAACADLDGNDLPALVSPGTASSLRRLCIAACDLLRAEAERGCDDLHSLVREGGTA